MDERSMKYGHFYDDLADVSAEKRWGDLIEDSWVNLVFVSFCFKGQEITSSLSSYIICMKALASWLFNCKMSQSVCVMMTISNQLH